VSKTYETIGCAFKYKDFHTMSHLKLSKAIKFTFADDGSIETQLSASSGKFIISEDIFLALMLLKQGVDFANLHKAVKGLTKKLHKVLEDENSFYDVLEDLKDHGFLIESEKFGEDRDSHNRFLDGFGNPWIQWAMISNEHRTNAFLKALKKVVTPTSTLVDLGAGSGIFSAAALFFKAKKVYAVEESSQALKIPHILKQMGLFHKDKFKGFFLNSYDVTIDDKVDIVISELFGNDPFQEGVLPTLKDFFSRLPLTGQKTICIPKGFEVFLDVCDIQPQCPLFPRLHSFQKFKRNLSLKPQGEFYDDFLKAFLIPSAMDHLHFEYNFNKNEIVSLHKSVSLYKISLEPPIQTKHLHTKKKFTLNIQKDPICPALILWFRIYVDDTETISNHPQQHDSSFHWKLLVVPLQYQEQLRHQDIFIQTFLSHEHTCLNLCATLKSGKRIAVLNTRC